MFGSNAEHAGATTADDHGRAARRVRQRKTVVAGDLVVVAGEVERPLLPAAFDDLQALDHAIDPNPRTVVGHARLVVVGAHPARPETELDPSFCDVVERRHLLGEHHRVAVVVAENECPDLDLGGDRCSSGKCGHRAVLAVEVVGHHDRRVALLLGVLGGVGPRHSLDGAVGLESETEGSGHGVRPYAPGQVSATR